MTLQPHTRFTRLSGAALGIVTASVVAYLTAYGSATSWASVTGVRIDLGLNYASFQTEWVAWPILLATGVLLACLLVAHCTLFDSPLAVPFVVSEASSLVVLATLAVARVLDRTAFPASPAFTSRLAYFLGTSVAFYAAVALSLFAAYSVIRRRTHPLTPDASSNGVG